MIQMVLATDKNGCIGKGGKLPFKLKTDLRNFAHVTQNTVCIMGRKTFESLKAPLQNRMNVVLTKHKEMTFNYCLYVAFDLLYYTLYLLH